VLVVRRRGHQVEARGEHALLVVDRQKMLHLDLDAVKVEAAEPHVVVAPPQGADVRAVASIPGLVPRVERGEHVRIDVVGLGRETGCGGDVEPLLDRREP
jgi:hypothetical protein